MSSLGSFAPCSKKFWRKVHFVPTLQDLSADNVEVDDQYISAPVAAADKLLMSRRPTHHKYKPGKQSAPSKETGPEAAATVDQDPVDATAETTTVNQDSGDTGKQATVDSKQDKKEEALVAEE
jgi:hypothetical protein